MKALIRKVRKMNISVGFNNTSSYGINNKQNIGFCGTRAYVNMISAKGSIKEIGKHRHSRPQEDYNLVRRTIALIRKQNPNAKAVREDSYSADWRTIHSGLKNEYELLKRKVKVGTQHVTATKHNPRSDRSSVTIRLLTKVSRNRVREDLYTLYPNDTTPKSVAKLNELFA